MDDDPVVQRAVKCLEVTRNQETQAAFDVVKAIATTADNRADQMMQYLDKARDWFQEMKE